MAEKLPSFKNPPVIEVVLGAQFEPVGTTAGHLGWFWQKHLGKEWTTAKDAERLPEQVERFGENRSLRLPRFGIKLQTQPAVGRLQIGNEGRDRLIQIQETKFVYNWIKANGDYPRYHALREDFDNYFDQLRAFIEDTHLGKFVLNQWEVTYVNHIPSGELWNEPSQWSNVLPRLLRPINPYGGTLFENMNADWRSEIPQHRGRLHIQLRHQPSKVKEDIAGVMVLHFTARGPVDDKQSLAEGLDLGHDTIVRTFDEITSPEAHTLWEKEDAD